MKNAPLVIVVTLVAGCTLSTTGVIGGDPSTPDSGIGTATGGASVVPPTPGTGGAVGTPTTPGADAGLPPPSNDAGTGPTGCASVLPAAVQALLSAKCTTCHGPTPVPGAPMSLVTYADLTAPAKSDASRTVAAMAVARMQSTTLPMPPAPATPATPTEIAAVQSWITAGYPSAGCVTPPPADGGTTTPPPPDPFATPPRCTSNVTWTGGNEGSASMNPGMACVSCHASMGDEAPIFAIAGTVYPSAHEPDRCNGVNGSTGARVVIVGADGQMVTLTPNAAGNFTYSGTVARPFQAKVTYMGRERIMATPQTSGDCNGCHTQTGAMNAPGRILLP